MKRVYIASGFDNKERAKKLADLLADIGIGVTVAWWELPLHLEEDPATRSLIASGDLHGVRRADLVVCLMKGDPATFDSAQLGTHGELGAACALGVPVILVSPTAIPGPFCVFHRHPSVIARIITQDPAFIAGFVYSRIPQTHGALMQFERGPYEWYGDTDG